MKNESQYGLLLLQRYLYEHTDDQHPVSVADILTFWQEHGIQAGRKSVYSAIEVLQSNGMDIVCVKSTQNRYFVGERLFELPELKLLVDAVESSRFITAKKSERLIEKLGKLTSESHARQLDRHIYMDGTAKPENECIYYSVDEIHNAIQEKRQITFQYYEYTPQKVKILKHNGYRYQFSPYALIPSLRSRAAPYSSIAPSAERMPPQADCALPALMNWHTGCCIRNCTAEPVRVQP